MSAIREVMMTDRTPATRPGPDPEWIAGRCPTCGGPAVSNYYWLGGVGYVRRVECWAALGAAPTCTWRGD